MLHVLLHSLDDARDEEHRPSCVEGKKWGALVITFTYLARVYNVS